MDFFTSLTHEKIPQNIFSRQNSSVENNYFFFFLDICAFRLDFETFQTEGPTTFTEVSGGLCVDTFQVTTVNILLNMLCI